MHNIIWTAYRPANMPPPPWGAAMDFNLVQDSNAATNVPARQLQEQSGRDEHSIMADAQFVDPARGDYRVKDGSPALALGFVNFPMDQFGVQKPELKAIARTPQLPQAKVVAPVAITRAADPVTWLGASVRNITSEGEMSAFGLPGVTGVLVLEVPAESPLAKAGLRKNDVILSVNGAKTADTATLLHQAPAFSAGKSLNIGLSRDQKETAIEVVQ
jgi:membrane-associated protease RseP (regulator of RpoE activity)